jgi:hypothetical protein
MEPIWTIDAVDEAGLGRLGDLIAFMARPGEAITLEGDLGAGKTTLARAIVRALLDDPLAEVPSPTFALVQTYPAARLSVTHADLYRIAGPAEVGELGLEEAASTGLLIVEWPERAPAALPASHIAVRLEEVADGARRRVSLTGHGTMAERVRRLHALARLIERAGWGDARLCYLQGDASARRYGRLRRPAGETAIVMDAPRRPDGPAVRDGLPYSRIAHLAEDVGPFLAIATELRQHGFSAPAILAADLDHGLLLVEDLGDRAFGTAMRGPTPQRELWTAATDTLIALRRAAPPTRLAAAGVAHELPALDRIILEIEVDLLPEWYWPEVKGAPAPPAVRSTYAAAWTGAFDLILADRPGWLLRDFHSPNLIWLPERAGIARVGIIDFQDALVGPWAHDLVSLLQDARVDVPADLEAELLTRYIDRVAAVEPGFDRERFIAVYRAYGAVRAARLVGLWIRLCRRDRKPGYLMHMPRTWDYLERNTAHPALKPLAAWLDRHLAATERRHVPRLAPAGAAGRPHAER